LNLHRAQDALARTPSIGIRSFERIIAQMCLTSQ
jgi:hypothetical protein